MKYTLDNIFDFMEQFYGTIFIGFKVKGPRPFKTIQGTFTQQCTSQKLKTHSRDSLSVPPKTRGLLPINFFNILAIMSFICTFAVFHKLGESLELLMASTSQIHLISPSCPRPNSALTVHKSGLKHRSSIHPHGIPQSDRWNEGLLLGPDSRLCIPSKTLLCLH